MNQMAGGANVRIPEVRVEKVHQNRDYLADAIDISIAFPVGEQEGIRHVTGVLLFSYVLHNRVRLDMEAPIAIDYAAGVAGRRLTVDGRIALKLANPLPLQPGVRSSGEPLMPRDRTLSAEEATLEALIAKASARNDTTVREARRRAAHALVHGPNDPFARPRAALIGRPLLLREL